MQRRVIQPRVDRQTYAQFKLVCHAHGVSVEGAIEALMREALKRAGVAVAEESITETAEDLRSR